MAIEPGAIWPNCLPAPLHRRELLQWNDPLDPTKGPPPRGAMRIAASMEGRTNVLHAAPGDPTPTWLFTISSGVIARPARQPTPRFRPVIGRKTLFFSELVTRSDPQAWNRFRPEALLRGRELHAGT